jgi:hypothetical protein
MSNIKHTGCSYCYPVHVNPSVGFHEVIAGCVVYLPHDGGPAKHFVEHFFKSPATPIFGHGISETRLLKYVTAQLTATGCLLGTEDCGAPNTETFATRLISVIEADDGEKELLAAYNAAHPAPAAE